MGVGVWVTLNVPMSTEGSGMPTTRPKNGSLVKGLGQEETREFYPKVYTGSGSVMVLERVSVYLICLEQ